MNGWIGVDLDGTLAQYDGWKGVEHIGDPVPAMAVRVLDWVEAGRDVRIFTARMYEPDPVERQKVQTRIEEWCLLHLGVVLPVTNVKDYQMVELWDDRCVQVIPNTGLRADGHP